MIFIPKLALEIQDLLLPATVLSPRLDDTQSHRKPLSQVPKRRQPVYHASACESGINRRGTLSPEKSPSLSPVTVHVDIMTASGSKVGADTLSRQPQGEVWSTMRWPNEHPTDSDMRLWRDAMQSICLSRSSISGVGCFVGHLHRVWRWFWDKAHSTLHHANLDGTTEDVFVSGQKPNRFRYSHSQPRCAYETICSVQPTL
jgi:hypothetical protein